MKMIYLALVLFAPATSAMAAESCDWKEAARDAVKKESHWADRSGCHFRFNGFKDEEKFPMEGTVVVECVATHHFDSHNMMAHPRRSTTKEFDVRVGIACKAKVTDDEESEKESD